MGVKYWWNRNFTLCKSQWKAILYERGKLYTARYVYAKSFKKSI